MTKILSKEVAFNGRLRTAIDGASIGSSDFQVLRNLRPTDANMRPVAGMTKINTSALASTGIRNAFHFRKAQPSESHVLAWTTDGKVWVYDGSVPAQGALTLLYTDTAGGSTGRFANAPGGALAYANGVEACLWGGDQFRCAGLIDYPATGQIYDYGDVVTNTKTDANNIATIHASNTPIDANTKVLLHFDTNLEDATANNHDATASGNAAVSTAQKKFGAGSCVFDGAGDYLSVADHADLDLSGGVFTIDMWVYIADDTQALPPLYYQATDANNYLKLYLVRVAVGGGYRYYPVLLIYAASSEVVLLYPTNTTFSAGGWHHIAVVENVDAWYMFVDGQLVGTTTDTSRAANFTGAVQIGYDGTNYFKGYIDELRISNSARWTSAFSPPSSAHGTGYASTTYIGSIMPLDGFKAFVATANDVATTMAVEEWNGTSWSSLTITDNTSSGGVSLAQTGTVTWASTAATSKPTVVEKVYLYWYKVVITGASDFGGVTLSNVTVSIPFQATKDIWDGEERPCNSFVVFDSPKYLDYTSNVLENEFLSTGTEIDASTFAKLVSLTTTDYLYAGFIERMAGVMLYIIDAYGNTGSVVLSWEYWNGAAWTALSATDGTMDGTKTLAKSGWVTWPPAERASEFKKDISAGSVNVAQTPVKSAGPLYYYRASFSGAIDADVRIYHVAGIPAPKDIRGYSFPMMHQNRPVLVSNTDGAKNTILIGAQDTANVFNGLDAYEYPIGQDAEINAAASLFLRFGSSVQDMLLLAKQGEIHLLEGNGTDSDPYRARLLSDKIGCRAPLTMTTVPVVDLGNGARRQLAIWESQRGIELFDGASLMEPPLSHDIQDKFDPTSANFAGASSNYGFYDPVLDEYHWCPVGSAEWVYSFKYKKWFEIVRGTAKYLYGGVPVMDTSGNSYTYGFDNAGYVHRLESGTTFDGNAIETTIRIGDMAWPEGSIMEKSRIDWYRLVAKACASSITARYYVDGSTGASHQRSISLANAGKRLANVVVYEHDEQAMLHGIEFVGGYDFEPLYLGVRYTLYPDQLS